MRGDARALVEQVSAAEILFDLAGQFGQKTFDADMQHQLHHAVDADERDDIEFGVHGDPPPAQSGLVPRMVWPNRLPVSSASTRALMPRVSRNGFSSTMSSEPTRLLSCRRSSIR